MIHLFWSKFFTRGLPFNRFGWIRCRGGGECVPVRYVRVSQIIFGPLGGVGFGSIGSVPSGFHMTASFVCC